MAAGREVRAGKAFVELTLRDKLQAGLRKAAGQLRAFSRVTATMGAALIGASSSIIAPLSAAVLQFASLGDTVHKMAARTGMSAEAVSELGHAANLSGTDLKTLETGVRRMQQTVADASAGITFAQDSLARFGLTAADLAGQAPEKQLEIFADRLAKISDPAERTAAAMEVFGRSGAMLIPLMSGGAAGIQQMREQARALGMTMSGDMANNAAALNDALGTMWSAIKALTINIGAALAPTITQVANIISGLTATVTKFVRENQGLIVTVAAVAAGIGLVGTALLAIAGAALLASFVVSGLATALSVVGAVVSFLLSPLGLVILAVAAVTAGVIAAVAAFFKFTETGRGAARIISSAFGQLFSFIKSVLGGIWNALTAGDFQLAGQIFMKSLAVAWQWGVLQLRSIWLKFKNWLMGLWEGLVNSFKSTWADLIDAVGFTEEADAIRSSMEAAGEKRAAALEQDLKAARADLDRAKGELDRLIAEAARKREEAGKQREKQLADAGLSDAGDEISRVQSKLTSQGTFSAAQAKLFGSVRRPAEERVAKAAEETAKHTKRIADLAERGRLVFA